MRPQSIEETLTALEREHYIAERSLATSVFLSLKLGRPLFLEGEPGVGKTEIVKVLANLLDTRLIRLQCFEGLDLSSAVYEWDYARQMLQIRLLEASGEREQSKVKSEIYSSEFLVKRPLLQALELQALALVRRHRPAAHGEPRALDQRRRGSVARDADGGQLDGTVLDRAHRHRAHRLGPRT